jgi:hypothetical protein
MDSQGQLYVPDYNNDRVWVFNHAGVNTHNLTGFYSPFSVATYGNRVYVTDVNTDNVSVLVNGVFTNSTDFTNIRGVATDADGNVYIADINDDSLTKLSPSFTIQGVATGIDGAFHVAVGPTGRIFVSAYLDDNVTILAPDLTVLGYLGQSGSGPGEFNLVRDVEVEVDGYIYVADGNNNNVQVFNPDLQLVGIIEGIIGARGVATDGVGRVYVSAQGDENVTVLTTNDLGDHQGPDITDVQVAPFNPATGQPVNISATLIDLTGVNNATLTYSYPGANDTTILMTLTGDRYQTTITGLPGNTTVSFQIWAEDTSLNHHTTTSPTYQFNVLDPEQPPIPPLLGIDPTLLGLAGVGLAGVAIVLVFVMRK